MFEKFSRSWELVKASAAVLRADKELMLFPVVSTLCTLLVLATFAVPAFALDLFAHDFNVLHAVFGFIFYFCQYAVIIFFNCALVAAAMIRLEGGDPSFADGLNIAKSRIGAILGYAAIAATVGLILQALKDKDNNPLVRILGSLIGVAWTLATFLVVPVLVSQDIGPIDALKRSVELLKRTWGENAIGNVGIGAAFGLITVAVVIAGGLITFGVATLSWKLAIAVALLFVVGLLLLGVCQAALSGIYSAALYRYATDGQAPTGFEGAGLQGAFRAK
jgi:hypothetical protein